MNRLAAFLNGWVARPHAWGQDDCIIGPLDWVSLVRGSDFAADIRMTYEGPTEAQRVYRFFTDPLPWATRVLEEQGGLARCATPVRGDVALFKAIGPGGRVQPTAGICIEAGHFACRAEVGGVLSLRPQGVMAAWEVGYVDP